MKTATASRGCSREGRNWSKVWGFERGSYIRKANKGDMMGHISITFNARVKVPFFGFEIWWQIYNSDFVTTNCDHVYFRNYCKQFYKAIKQNLCPMPWQFNAPHNKKTRRKGSTKICSCCMIKIIYWFYIMYFIFYYYSTIEKIVSLIVIFLYFILSWCCAT